MKYKKVDFKIVFTRPVRFTTYPTFIFRSILGKELRKMSCLFNNRVCSDCSISQTCVYAKLFETHISKSNSTLEGRNRASHPFLLFSEIPSTSLQNKLKLQLTLIGSGTDYLPYFYYALQKAGKSGIFKARTRFVIKNVLIKGQTIIESEDTINNKIPNSEWVFNKDTGISKVKKLRIDFISPLRLKIMGKYAKNFDYTDLIRACIRRLEILEGLYGSEEMFFDLETVERKTENTNLHWTDLNYYSARQQNSMKLGGVTGYMDVEGNFSNAEVSLLKGCELFNVGKNTGFGLGKIALKFG